MAHLDYTVRLELEVDVRRARLLTRPCPWFVFDLHGRRDT
jgi:hypothetical protein